MTVRTTVTSLTAVLGAACLSLVPLAASAETLSAESYAEGKFLSGNVAGIDLDNIVSIAPATANNDGSSAIQEESNPLSATVLNSITVAPGTIALTDLNGVDVGVLGQYAIARNDGTSFASSGTIGSDGAISVSPGSGGRAIVDLSALLGSNVTSQLANLKLELVGIAAQAEGTLDGFSGDYALADLKLSLDVPAVANLTDNLVAALGPVQDALSGLSGANGQLAQILDQVLRGANGALGILGSGANIKISVDADVQGIVNAVTSTVLSDQALSINLDTGSITVDLDQLPSAQTLNNMAPGTELLTTAVVGDIVNGIQRLLNGYLDGLEATVLKIIRSANIQIDVELSVLDSVKTGEKLVETVTNVTQIVDKVTGKVLGLLDPNTGLVTSLVPGLAGSDLLKSLNGLLSGLISGLLGLGNGVVTKVVQEVTTVLEPVFELLETKVDLQIIGSLTQFQGGTGVSATADLKVLGQSIPIDLSLFLGPITEKLVTTLLGADGAVGQIVDGLSTKVLSPVLDAIAGPGTGTLNGLLSGLVSVKVNVQELKTALQGAGPNGQAVGALSTQTYFTQTAVRVSVLGGNLATVNLATATVGPNAALPPGGGGDDDDDDDNGGGGGGGTNTAGGNLAYTGGSLALLALLVALLLLGAGVYMATRRQNVAAALAAANSDDALIG